LRKRTFLTVLSFIGVAAALVVTSCGPSGEFGKPITTTEKTTISEIRDDPGSFDGKTVTVQGQVATVDDDGRGFQLDNGYGVLLYVKVVGDFKVARGATYHLATAEGKVEVDKKTEELRLMATGVEVK